MEYSMTDVLIHLMAASLEGNPDVPNAIDEINRQIPDDVKESDDGVMIASLFDYLIKLNEAEDKQDFIQNDTPENLKEVIDDLIDAVMEASHDHDHDHECCGEHDHHHHHHHHEDECCGEHKPN